MAEIYYNNITNVVLLNDDNTVVIEGEPSGITTAGLTKWLDAANTDSYPGTGTNWYDLLPGGATATLSGTIAWSSLSGGTFNQTGSGRVIMNDDLPITNTIDALTISIWLRPTTLGIWQSPITMNDLGFLQLMDSNLVAWYWYIAGNFGWYGITSTDTFKSDSGVTLNDWVNIVCVNDGTDVKMYIDSVLQSTIGGQSSNTVSTTNYQIGARSSEVGEWFHGYYSHYLTYNRALSSTEVLQNFNTLKDRYTL